MCELQKRIENHILKYLDSNKYHIKTEPLKNNTNTISFELVQTSDGSGMEKVGFGRVLVYKNSQMSDSDMSGIGKVGLGREMKFRASAVFG